MSEREEEQVFEFEIENSETNNETADTDVREIAGQPKYYTTGQVAKILGENESTIRFWCDEFEQFLKIQRSGRNRQFTLLDIKKLEYIRYLLHQENFTIKQVKEFLSTKEAELMRPIEKERERIIINALSQVIISEIDQHFKELEQNIAKNILEEIKAQSSVLHTFIQENLNHVEENLQKQNEQLRDKINTLEKAIADRDARFISFVENFRSREKPQTLYEKIKHLFKKK